MSVNVFDEVDDTFLLFYTALVNLIAFSTFVSLYNKCMPSIVILPAYTIPTCKNITSQNLKVLMEII